MNTILEGSNQLLLDVADELGDNQDYIVVGGWSPYLRNKEIHPGTLDVDLLFPQSYEQGQMEEAAKSLLDKGFLVSAKHSFQLLKPYQIGERHYIYNVDFLHPVLEKSLTAGFRDIVDFDITIDGASIKRLKSICMPHGDILFQPEMTEVMTVEGRKIRMLSPAGTVFSKLKSCFNQKRPRDIYDILLSLREDQSVWKTLQPFCEANDDVKSMVESFRKNISKEWLFFQKCLQEFNVEATDGIKAQLLNEPVLVPNEHT